MAQHVACCQDIATHSASSAHLLLLPSTMLRLLLPVPAVIKDFCKQLGVDNKQVQGVIRLAKKNGEKLGFLA
jgi:hypothetical protein